MDRARLLELVDAYLECRLGDAERAELQAELTRSRSACGVFWEYVHQHAQLAELLAEGRGRRLAERERATRLPRRSSPARRWAAAVAAALLVAGLGWLLRPPPAEETAPVGPSLPRLAVVRGDVQVLGSDNPLTARVGLRLHPGLEVRTGEGGFAVVAYDDRSRLELAGDTAVRLLGGADDPAGRGVFLVRGVVNADVRPQPAGRPMMLRTQHTDLFAPAARFSSAAVLDETRIEVEEGRAVLAPRGEKRTIDIPTGAAAVASAETVSCHSAPLQPTAAAPFAVLDDESGPVLGLAALADHRTVAVACWNGVVRLWDTRTRQSRPALDGDRKRALALGVAGRLLVANYELDKPRRGASVLVWDVARRQVRHELPPTLRAHAVAFTPDGRTLVLAGHDRQQRGVLVWDLGDRRERLTLGGRGEHVQCVAVSPDGRLAAAGYRDGNVRLWDLHTGRVEATLTGHTRAVQSLAFRAGGDMLASGGRDGSVRLWSVSTGEERRRLTGRFQEVRCLAFAPDGRTLASGHGGFATLWDVGTGRQRTMLKAHKFAVTAVVYLDGGRTLATAGWDRTVKLWDLRPTEDF